MLAAPGVASLYPRISANQGNTPYMNQETLNLLRCPACNAANLMHSVFDEGPNAEIFNGVVWCRNCHYWYPVEDGLLELLAGELVYWDDRQNFWACYADRLMALGLRKDEGQAQTTLNELQAKQQAHFDWYAENRGQTYLAYERMPFWRAFDSRTFEAWRPIIRANTWLLDVGCAQGRSTFQLADLSLNIVAFDISKRLVRQAIERYRSGHYTAKIAFFVADALKFPLVNESVDYILVYGVLHHLPDPGLACQEITRILKHGGRYFGVENNPTIFRSAFELLQRLIPIWHEEAGPQALMDDANFQEWFRGNGVRIDTYTSVFVPPHLVNLLGNKIGHSLLAASDRIARSIGFLRNNGGIVVICGRKD
jgi:SAM-dependent methyltransferase/uncharacterized protein YbaR (Trm112 family)